MIGSDYNVNPLVVFSRATLTSIKSRCEYRILSLVDFHKDRAAHLSSWAVDFSKTYEPRDVFKSENFWAYQRFDESNVSISMDSAATCLTTPALLCDTVEHVLPLTDETRDQYNSQKAICRFVRRAAKAMCESIDNIFKSDPIHQTFTGPLLRPLQRVDRNSTGVKWADEDDWSPIKWLCTPLRLWTALTRIQNAEHSDETDMRSDVECFRWYS